MQYCCNAATGFKLLYSVAPCMIVQDAVLKGHLCQPSLLLAEVCQAHLQLQRDLPGSIMPAKHCACSQHLQCIPNKHSTGLHSLERVHSILQTLALTLAAAVKFLEPVLPQARNASMHPSIIGQILHSTLIANFMSFVTKQHALPDRADKQDAMADHADEQDATFDAVHRQLKFHSILHTPANTHLLPAYTYNPGDCADKQDAMFDAVHRQLKLHSILQTLAMARLLPA